MAGLSGADVAQVLADLQTPVEATLENDAGKLAADLKYWNDGYQANHNGGQTAAQEAGLIKPLQDAFNQVAQLLSASFGVTVGSGGKVATPVTAATAAASSAQAGSAWPVSTAGSSYPVYVSGGGSSSLFSNPTILLALAGIAVTIILAFKKK